MSEVSEFRSLMVKLVRPHAFLSPCIALSKGDVKILMELMGGGAHEDSRSSSSDSASLDASDIVYRDRREVLNTQKTIY